MSEPNLPSGSMNFDYCSSSYSNIFDIPYIKYGDNFTLMQLLGSVSGLSVLDLGCGEGELSFELKEAGASRVVGIDLSESMIQMALEREQEEKVGVEFLVGNVLDAEVLGSFDVVMMSFLLTLSHSRENVAKMLTAAHVNLRPGGLLLVLDDNLFLDPSEFPRLEKYGYSKEVTREGPLQEGDIIKCQVHLRDDRIIVHETFLPQSAWSEALERVGFSNVSWHSPTVSADGLSQFGEEYWKDYLSLPVTNFVTATKS